MLVQEISDEWMGLIPDLGYQAASISGLPWLSSMYECSGSVHVRMCLCDCMHICACGVCACMCLIVFGVRVPPGAACLLVLRAEGPAVLVNITLMIMTAAPPRTVPAIVF